uniref:Protein RUFY3 n=1 Tax=Glossina brevipalpis TaxID=37001 RepID=A0A1A9W7Z0_9MUSC
MRALVEDTKKLTVNNTTGNNNNNIQAAVTVAATSITSTITTTTATTSTTTTTTEELAIIKTSSSSSNTTTTTATPANKTSFINKTYKMQQQQQQQQQQQHMTIMRTTILNNKGNNCPTTGVKLRTKQTQHHNNNTAPTGNAAAPAAAATAGTNTTIVALPKATPANHASEEISGGVQDTIYLCNFRVSVDGEWLCLKELQDIDATSNTVATGGKRHSQYSQKNKRWSAGDRNSYSGIEDNGIFALHNFIAGRRLFDYEQEQTYNTHMLTAAPHAREPGFVGVFGGGGSNSNEWSHLSGNKHHQRSNTKCLQINLKF